jgi:hypothetical protein
MFKIFKLCVFLVLASVNVLSAATYYVSTTGSDSNNGSSSSPFLTISKSISAATSPGDVVNIGAGTYSGSLTFNHAGTSGNPITFIGSGVVVSGNLNISANYVTVSGITDSPPSAGGYGAININNSYDILTNCTVTGYGATASDQATAIILYGSYNLVVNCVVKNLDDIDAFHIFGHDQTLLGCTVTNLLEVNYALNHTDFIQSYSYSGAVCYNILVKNCLCVDSTCQSMNLETDGNPNFYGWQFVNDVWANVQNPAYCGIPQTSFLNCVFYKVAQNSSSGDQAISFYGIANYSSVGSKVVNCVFLKDGSNPSSTSLGGIGADGVTLSTLFIDHNYFAGNSYAAKSGAYIGTNPINGGDPKFLNEAGYDFHLQTNSVLIGAGTNLIVANLLGLLTNLYTSLTTDRDGNAWPTLAAWDVGAYEYNANNGNLTPPPAPSGLQILLSP